MTPVIVRDRAEASGASDPSRLLPRAMPAHLCKPRIHYLWSFSRTSLVNSGPYRPYSPCPKAMWYMVCPGHRTNPFDKTLFRVYNSTVVELYDGGATFMDGNSARPDTIEALSAWLKILSEPKRLAILDLLMQGVQCNCELGDELGIAPNLISHHLSALHEADIVQAERDPLDARWIYYSIKPEKLAEITASLCEFLNPGRIQPRRASCGPLVSGCRTKGQVVAEK